MGINILFLGLPAVLSGALFLSSGSTPQIPQEHSSRVRPDIRVVDARARRCRRDGISPVSHALWPASARCGRESEAADAAGVRVPRIRYACVIISGVLAAIGGAYLSIGQSSLFTRNMSAGRGFIALAALIFGKWRPVPTMLACLLFGFADALTIQMQGVAKLPSGEDIPVQFVQMIPYVVTIVVLAGFIGQSRAPGALGVPYTKER
jgi:simple sugar transport system permease protein